MNKTIYPMSSTGECARVLGARRLGYEEIPRDDRDLKRLNYYSMCESLAAQQIMDEGYRLEPSTLCQICKERYGNERYGIHVEIELPLLHLIGHLDRRLLLENDKKLPVEIKSLGRFSWERFARNQFDSFPEYAAQEACYLEAEHSPGIYWVLNRDTGDYLKYLVNDFNNEVDLPGFERLTLPITFDSLVDKLIGVEVSVQSNELPEASFEVGSDSCRWCRYKFLCVKSEPEAKALDLPDLIEAARLYKEGHELEKQASEKKSTAVFALLEHAKSSNIDKYQVSGLSVSYRGQRTRDFIDNNLLKSENPELYNTYLRHSKPFDDYSIRILGKEEK